MVQWTRIDEIMHVVFGEEIGSDCEIKWTVR